MLLTFPVSPHPPASGRCKVGSPGPNQTSAIIGERLSAAGASWAWYAGGWNDALAGRPHARYRFHHQPFVYLANYAAGTAARALYLKDESEFFGAS